MDLFSETSDVFRQLQAAKGQVASEIADHLSSIQTITNTLNTQTTAESPQVLNIIQVNVYSLKSTWNESCDGLSFSIVTYIQVKRLLKKKFMVRFDFFPLGVDWIIVFWCRSMSCEWHAVSAYKD